MVVLVCLYEGGVGGVRTSTTPHLLLCCQATKHTDVLPENIRTYYLFSNYSYLI